MSKKKKFVLAGALTALVLLLALGVILDRLRPYETPKTGICSKLLTREVLEESLRLGTRFLMNNQKPEGSFVYEYDWLKRLYTPGDSQVRQAGAAWGLALINQFRPDIGLRSATERALVFFDQHTRTMPDGSRYIVYPGDKEGKTGTVALVVLTYIDYIRSVGGDLAASFNKRLDGYLKFLLKARTPDGRWHKSYSFEDGRPFGGSTPYFDGEALLALVKAAKYLGQNDLKDTVTAAADSGYRYNIVEALKIDPDSKITKGYYQWSSMVFFELATSGWPEADKYGAYLFDLADWMIDVHKTLKRRRNTGYAYEGIIHAYRLADSRRLTRQARKYLCVIEKGLEKLTSWQVGSSLANKFIREKRVMDPVAVGGVQNHRKEAALRIDVTQHQMHAVILALRYVYIK